MNTLFGKVAKLLALSGLLYTLPFAYVHALEWSELAKASPQVKADNTTVVFSSRALKLSVTASDYSNDTDKWNYRIDWTRQARRSGSICINGNLFINNAEATGSNYTGYSLEPEQKYRITYFSGQNCRGTRVANRVFKTLPAEPADQEDTGDTTTPVIVPTTPNVSINISTNNLPSGQLGQPYSASVSVSAPGATYAANAYWTGLPTGIIGQGLPEKPNTVLGIIPPTSFTVDLKGTPKQTGQFPVTLVVETGSSKVSKQYTLSIDANTGKIDFFGETPTNAKVGEYYKFSFVYYYSPSGSSNYAQNAYFTGLPDGITTGGSSGSNTTFGILCSKGTPCSVQVSGTPTGAGTYPITLTIDDQNGVKASRTFTLVVNPSTSVANPTLQINTVYLATAMVGAPYSGSVSFSYNGSYALNATWTGLPTGIIGQGLPSNPNYVLGILPGLQNTVTLSGTPTQAGTYSVLLSMTDQYGATASKYFNLIVGSAASLTINTSSLASGMAGQWYSASVPYSYNGNIALNATWSGLPDGIVGQGLASNPNQVLGILGGSTLTLSGTPTKAGTYTVTLSMTDQGSLNISKTFTLVVQ